MGFDSYTPALQDRDHSWCMKRLIQIVAALMPLVLTPITLGLFAEYGATEKDVVWIIPWTVWSIVFAACSFFLMLNHWPWKRLFLRATVVATGVVAVLGIIAALAGQLGIGGRI
jgi:hypothetical protein